MMLRHLTSFSKRALIALASTLSIAPAFSDNASESPSSTPQIIKSESYSVYAKPKYSPSFRHFDYVNPDAPKGGELRRLGIGSYDSFNPYASRGDSAAGIDVMHDTLMTASLDEIDVYYPLIAKSLEYPEDYRWVVFNINPDAKDHSGASITAEDVAFSFNKFMEQGIPQFRTHYKNVKNVEVLDEHKVRFSFEEPGREDIGSLVSLTVLPKHFWKDKDLSKPLTKPPVGTGPYKVKEYSMGQSMTYERIQDHWAEELPTRVGLYNFNLLKYDYYRDSSVALESFKAGELDFRLEHIAKQWAEDYKNSAVQRGDIQMESLDHSEPQRMQAFVFNTKSDLFKDRRVRQAINYALDFGWMNKNLFYDQYERTVSYFQNTEYMANNKPTEAELEILNEFKDQLPKEVFGNVWRPEDSDASGNIRESLRKAMSLLKQSGWELKGGKLVSKETNQPFEFELVYYSSSMERVIQPFRRNLERIGINLKPRLVETSQYLNLLRSADYDMISGVFLPNPYPHRTMPLSWHSDYVDSTYNQANVSDPIIDALMDGILRNQEDPEKLEAYAKAFDRVALWNFYVVPHWHSSTYRIAYWNKFSRPDTRPDYDLGIDTWWYDEDKAKTLRQ